MTDHDTTTDRYAHLEDAPTWELTNMVKALSSGISMFLNTPDDTARLEAAKRVLRERKAAARRTGK